MFLAGYERLPWPSASGGHSASRVVNGEGGSTSVVPVWRVRLASTARNQARVKILRGRELEFMASGEYRAGRLRVRTWMRKLG